MTTEKIDRNQTAGLPDHIRMTAAGRLVLTGGAHDVLPTFDGSRPLAADAVAVFRTNHEARRDWCKARGITFSQWIFPDPLVLATDDTAAASDVDDSDWIDVSQIKSLYLTAFQDPADDADIHYPISLLRGASERQRLTDSHYSPVGNLHVAAHVAKVVTGTADPDHIATRLGTAHRAMIVGDLGLQCSPNRQEEVLALAKPTQITVTTNGLGAGNNGTIILIENSLPTGAGTLLIFGDSFFGVMLTEMARYWDRIVFARTPHFHYEIITAVGPTAIVMGMAERYIGSQWLDSRRPHALAFPLIKGRPQTPSVGFAVMWSRFFDQAQLSRIQDESRPEKIGPAASAATLSAAQIEEQTAFALWKLREGDASGLAAAARSAMWNAARPAYMKEASILLHTMGTRGLQVSGRA
ncbi:MAG: hypothetical protein KJ834_08205 [Alphaproteobacteria bacterium]|nr:hypothetical protein [Alphaproteobacteria bacterium]